MNDEIMYQTSHKQFLEANKNFYYTFDEIYRDWVKKELENFNECIGLPKEEGIWSSVLREEELNSFVGSNWKSQHLHLEAGDKVYQNISLDEILQRAEENSNKLKAYSQIIIERNKKGDKWIHIGLLTKRFIQYRKDTQRGFRGVEIFRLDL